MTLTSVTLIHGINVGFEFIGAMPEEDIQDSLIVDLVIFRLIFTLS